MRKIKRGEIYYADLSPVVGSEQGGIRPVIILQNDTGNCHSPTTLVVAVTSKTTKNYLPTHIKVYSPMLRKNSVAMLEQISNARYSIIRMLEEIIKLFMII